MKILQNQDRFVTPEYRQVATPLRKALRSHRLLAPWRRWKMSGFLAGGLMYALCSEFDVVVTVGHRSSLAFGCLNRLAPRARVHIAKEIWLGEDRSKGLKRGLKILLGKIYRFGFANVATVIVTAREEIRSYADILRLPHERFEFIPWPSNIDAPRKVAADRNCILAAGRSLRDWDTFFKAVSGLPCRVVVVATRSDMQDREIPENVDLFCDIPRDQYLELLEASRIVVVPLQESRRSAGQAVFLEAMALGKPVVAARVTGAADYLEEGRNALLYPPGNSEVLRNLIRRLLSDPVLAEHLSAEALRSIEERFNKRAYALHMLEIASRCLAAGEARSSLQPQGTEDEKYPYG